MPPTNPIAPDSTRNCMAMVVTGRSEGTSQSDLTNTFQDRHKSDICNADRSHQQCHASQDEKQGINVAFYPAAQVVEFGRFLHLKQVPERSDGERSALGLQ